MISQEGNLIERFNKQGITLLARPRKTLELLRVYKNEINQTNVLRTQGRLEDFITLRADSENRDSQFKRPSPSLDDIPSGHESGVIFHKKKVGIGLEFFKGVFEPLISKLGIDISANIDKNKIYAATFTLKSFHSEEIDNSALENSLKEFKIRDDKYPDFANVNYYVNTGVYYCNSLEIMVAELDKAEFESITSTELVNAGIKVSNAKQGCDEIKYDETIAFGARFALLQFSMSRDEPIKVNDVPTDESKSVLGEENIVLSYIADIEEP
jgi:hypothetical protein